MKEYIWYDSKVDNFCVLPMSMADAVKMFEQSGRFPAGSIALNLVVKNNELLGNVEFSDGLLEFLGEL